MADTKVIMPQMGESIFEGTITKWLKKPGDKIERDEPLFEISTDKVDSEIPAPAAGTLQEILVKEGETVQINTVVAVIGDGAAKPEAPKKEAPKDKVPSAQGSGEKRLATDAAEHQGGTGAQRGSCAGQRRGRTDRKGVPSAQGSGKKLLAADAAKHQGGTGAQRGRCAGNDEEEQTEEPAEKADAAENGSGSASESGPEGERVRSSPLVRRIAKEHGIDLTAMPAKGTGINGRITKTDILSYIEQGGAATRKEPVAAKAAPAAPAAAPAAASAPKAAPATPAPAPPIKFSGDVERVPLSAMRKAIAEHMVMSRKTSAHVTTFFEVDCTRILDAREKLKPEFEKSGVHLTVTPFFVQAAVRALKKFPIVNSSLDGDTIVYKRPINVGIAVNLEWGLIVPVIKGADEKNLLGLAHALNDLGERARTKKLTPDDVKDGTFTITNPGLYGGLIGTPIINQPQVAIMGMGGIKKRAVVINDAIAIRSMIYLSLSFDHRVVDGATADQFMAEVQKQLEEWQA